MKGLEVPFNWLKGGSLQVRLIILGLLGVALMFIGGVFSPNFPSTPSVAKKTDNTVNQFETPKTAHSYEEQLENKLSSLLTQVRGAGKVAVHVSLESNGYQEHAQNVIKEARTVQERDTTGGIRTTTETKESVQVLLSKKDGVDIPVTVQEKKPLVKGVLIIAEGAIDSTVKLNLMQAVEYGMGIPSYKITVLPQKG